MSSIYSIGDLAYIGGGFDSVSHGHNVVEAVAVDVPVVIGPDYGNFKNIVEPLLQLKGIEVATCFEDLGKKVEKMVKDKDYRKKIAQNATSVYADYSSRVSLEQKLLRKFLSRRQRQTI